MGVRKLCERKRERGRTYGCVSRLREKGRETGTEWFGVCKLYEMKREKARVGGCGCMLCERK